MNINILMYNEKDELVSAAVGDETICKGDIIEIENGLYDVIEEGSTMRIFDHVSKIIELEKYKEKKKKVG